MPRRPFLPSPRRSPSRKEPVTVHLRKPPSDSVIPRHSHYYGQLSCPMQGGIRVLAAGESWIVPVFRAVWIPPHVEHELVMLGKVDFHAVYIDPHFGSLPRDKCCVVQMSSLMRQLIQNLADDVPDGGRRHKLVMSLLLEEMKSVRPLSLGLQLPTDRRLAVICNGLMDDPASPWSLAEWASRAGASERTLARLFQTELATSFGLWRQQVRLAKAVDLMSRGVPVTDIAAELGYANVSAFSSMFKRALGVPPSQFNVTVSHGKQ